MSKIVDSVKIKIYYIDGKMSKIFDSVKIKMFTSVLWRIKDGEVGRCRKLSIL